MLIQLVVPNGIKFGPEWNAVHLSLFINTKHIKKRISHGGGEKNAFR